MPTNTAGTNARDLQMQVMHYLRKTVNFNDTGIGTGIAFANPLPAGAIIHPLASTIVVRTAFNAGTTNNLLVGTSAGGNQLVATADSAAGVAGVKTFALATVGVNARVANDTSIYVTYTQTGTAATAGVADIVIAYSLNNDA